MKSIVLVLCFVGLASAAKLSPRLARAPQQQYRQQYVAQPQQYVAQPQQYSVDPLKPKPIAILSQNANSQYDGNFNYDFQSENGIAQETVGSVKVLDPEHQAQVMQGRYAYTAPDGTPIEATWYADETGFHVQGAHLPVAPPIPEAIARSLEYIRSLPPAKEDQYKQ
uniref:Endocuticle structural glycoprotein SgAbd-1 n=1 Tax=Lygus hesperus TaxID=30085 RepID=A0A146LQ20_LYGHE